MKPFFSLLLGLLLTSCGLAVVKPIKTTEFPAGEKPAKHLVILLSGRGAGEDYFKEQEWVPIARRYGSSVDFIAPFAHFGYYSSEQLLPRLYEDVILPARQKGYESISIAGISMGGLGSLLVSHQYPELIDRIYLIAPYLGKDSAQQEIKHAGGLQNWTIKPEDETNWSYFIWQRLKDITSDPKLKNKIFLGYGKQDRLNGHELLASALPKQQVITIEGGHKDVVFTQLWTLMNEKGYL